jgi:hypothetical protein
MNASTPTPATAAPAKSRRRWYILGFLLLVAATPVALYFIAGWMAEREMAELLAEMDAEDPGWRWPEIVGKLEPIPDEMNSVEQILKVRHLAVTPGYFDTGSTWDTERFIVNSRLTVDQVRVAETAFSRCDPRLREEARKLKDLPHGRYRIPADGNLFTADVDDLQKSRTTIWVLEVDAVLRAQEGDLDGAAESCQAMLNTAGALRGYPSLIGLLVRVAEQTITKIAIERVLAQGTVSEPQLKKLQELLQREADDDGLYQVMRGERAAIHQMYLSVRDGKATISQVLNNGGNSGPSATGRLLDAFPNVILKGYPDFLRMMNERVEACKLEPGLRDDALHKLDEEARTKGNLMTRMMFPAVGKVSNASQRTQAWMRCATVAVAAERYRLKVGAWPPTLDRLVEEGLLAKVPTDPYDGKLLRWIRTPTGAIVYSVGADRIDNGGKDLGRTNFRAEGVDYGFELWDPKMRGVPPPVEQK